MSPGDDPVAADDGEYEEDGIEESHPQDEKPKAKRRTKTGCLTCRRRRIKCGEERPVCKNCIKSKRECAGYGPPTAHHQLPGQLPGDNPRQEVIPHSFNHFFNAPGHYHVHPYPEPPGFGSKEGVGAFTAAYPAGTPFEASRSSLHGIYSGQHENQPSSAAFFPGPWTSTGPDGTYSPVPAEFPLTHSHLDHPNHIIGGAEEPYCFPNSEPGQSGLRRTATIPSPSFSMAYGGSMGVLTSEHMSHTSPGSIPLPGHANTFMPSRIQHFADETYDDPDDPFDIVEDLHDRVGNFSMSDPFQGMSREVAQPYQPSIDSQSRGGGQDFNALKTLYPESPLLHEECQPIFQHFLDVTGPCMSIFDRATLRMDSGIRTLPWTHELPKLALHHPALAYAVLAVGALHLARLGNNSEDVAVDYFTRALCCVKGLLEKKETRGEVSTLATILLLAYYEVIAGDHSRWSLHLSGAAKLIMENNFADTIRNIKAMRKAALSPEPPGLQRPWGFQDTTDRAGIHRAFPALLDDEEWELDQVLVGAFMGQHVDYDVQVQANFVHTTPPPFLSPRQFEETRLLMEMYWWFCKQDLFQSMLSGDAPTLAYSKWKFCPPRGRMGITDKAYASVDHLWLILGRLTEFGYRDRKRKLRVVAANGGEWIPAPGFLDELPHDAKFEKSAAEGHEHAKTPQDARPSIYHQPSRPVANEGRTRSVKSATPGSQQAPAVPMYGMLPLPSSPVSMSSSFKAVEAELQRGNGSSPSDNDSPVHTDLDTDLRMALHEHFAISSTLSQFADLLKDGFQPIENTILYRTPFGPAVRYNSPTIASLWTFYYVARIVCRRLHPHSPPAAMVSAAVNSSFTYADAQQLGRICAGLFVEHDLLSQAGQSDHLTTSAVMESAFALLFAAIQYQDASQRSWTIDKLNYVANFTGLASSAAIASACEATWSKLGEAGKGPPYDRTMTQDHSDIRISPKSPKLGGSTILKQERSHAEKEHESRFVHHDRDLIDRHASTRTYWAIGLLSVEDDLKAMALHDG